VKRDARDLYERLTTMTGESVTVMWDRRQASVEAPPGRPWLTGAGGIATTPAPNGLNAW
jgi:hypothetical protein